MDRDEFMELVYETFADEPDNVLANGIIEAADAYAEHEKAQLSQEGTTFDLISKFIDGLEEIFADLRERHVDDSVCGLCEYDGAYIGQSGDWCNECPGFERDDCFKLSDETRKKWTDEIIKALPTIQPQSTAGQLNDGARSTAQSTDLIDRQAAIDELRKFKPEIIPYEKARIYVKKTVKTMYDRIVELPTIQPEQCGDKSYTLWKESYEELKRRMDELTSCSDIISRQAALDAVSGCGICTQKLVDLPTIQPEPHEGHWIEGKIYRGVIECNCSECGQLMTTAASVRMNYCPNCGAKMKGERQK